MCFIRKTINAKKCVLNPVPKLSFLGAEWTQSEVMRKAEVDPTLKELIARLQYMTETKEKQQTRGYLNYYLSFAGKVHSIVNRALLEPLGGTKYLYALMEARKVKFRDPEHLHTNLFTDATVNQLGWCRRRIQHTLL